MLKKDKAWKMEKMEAGIRLLILWGITPSCLCRWFLEEKMKAQLVIKVKNIFKKGILNLIELEVVLHCRHKVSSKMMLHNKLGKKKNKIYSQFQRFKIKRKLKSEVQKTKYCLIMRIVLMKPKFQKLNYLKDWNNYPNQKI